MRRAGLGLLLVAAAASAGAADDAAAKIRFDLSRLNEAGLAGPPNGLRAVHYEFCIPETPGARHQVASIDPTAAFHPGSRGRIGCAPDQALVVGSTHQPDARRVLLRLAALHFVERIDEAFFE